MGSLFRVDGEQIIQGLGWGDYKATGRARLLIPAVGHLPQVTPVKFGSGDYCQCQISLSWTTLKLD